MRPSVTQQQSRQINIQAHAVYIFTQATYSMLHDNHIIQYITAIYQHHFCMSVQRQSNQSTCIAIIVQLISVTEVAIYLTLYN